MSVEDIAVSTVGALLPYMPYLVKAGEGAAGEVGKRLTGSSWELAKTLWAKLHPAIQGRPAAMEAIHDIIETPSDERLRNVLIWQLEKLLKEQRELAVDLNESLGSANLTTHGERSIIVGRDANATSMVTGDYNSVIVRDVKLHE